MAQKVTRIGCRVTRDVVGGDVGIDDEGTVLSINSDCLSKGYANGNYSTFYSFDTFILNSCISEQFAGYPHYRNYNVSQDQANSGDIKIEGGEFKCLNQSGAPFSSVDDLNGAFRSISIVGTVLKDTVINFTANNAGNISLSPVLEYSIAGTSEWNACTIIPNSGNTIDTDKLKIVNKVVPFSPSTGLVVINRANNASNKLFVRNVHTPSMPIRIVEQGANPSISSTLWCYDNITPALVILNEGAKVITSAKVADNFTIEGGVL